MGPLHRGRVPQVAAHPVVAALEGDALATEEAPDDEDGLSQALHPDGVVVEGDAGLFVLRAHVTRAQAQLQATLAEQVDGGRLARQHDRVAQVVVEDEGSHSQAGGGLGHRHQRGQGRQHLHQMVGDQERVVAELLHPPGGGDELGAAGPTGGGDAEAEGPRRVAYLPGAL